MKLQKTLEMNGLDVIKEYIIPQASAMFKLDIKPEQVDICVWSETKKQFIPFKGENIKFMWSDALPVAVKKTATPPSTPETLPHF